MSDTCPRCRAPLQDVRGVSVCLSCGGAFVPAEAVDTVRRAFDDHAQSMAQLAAQQASRRVESERSALCPRCLERMARFRVGPVEVDTCFAHGSWYDRGELRAVKQALEAGAATTEVPLPEEPAAPEESGLDLARRPDPRPPAAVAASSFLDPGAMAAISDLQRAERAAAEDERRRRRRRRRRGTNALDIVEDVLDLLT